jgi:hypothetical protein
VISVARLSRGIAAAAAAAVLSASVGVGSGAAEAAPAPPLSHLVLSQALPGFALLPNGLFDGPLPKSMLDSYSNQARWRRAVANGSLTGFVRAWSRTYQRGLALIYLTAIRMPDPSSVALFTSSIATLASNQPDATMYAVTRIKGATAYRTNPHVQIGRVTGYWISFTRGNTGFFLYAVVPPRSLTAAQVGSLALQQATHATGG